MASVGTVGDDLVWCGGHAASDRVDELSHGVLAAGRGRGEVDDQRDEPLRADASGCAAMLINADHPVAPTRLATARIAMELTLCQQTPSSVAIAEMVLLPSTSSTAHGCTMT